MSKRKADDYEIDNNEAYKIKSKRQKWSEPTQCNICSSGTNYLKFYGTLALLNKYNTNNSPLVSSPYGIPSTCRRACINLEWNPNTTPPNFDNLEDMQSRLQACINTKLRYIFILLNLKGQGRLGHHENAIMVDTYNKQIIRIEPNIREGLYAIPEYTSEYNPKELDTQIETQIAIPLTYTYFSPTKLYDYENSHLDGTQTIESSSLHILPDAFSGLCVTHTFYMIDQILSKSLTTPTSTPIIDIYNSVLIEAKQPNIHPNDLQQKILKFNSMLTETAQHIILEISELFNLNKPELRTALGHLQQFQTRLQDLTTCKTVDKCNFEIKCIDTTIFNETNWMLQNIKTSLNEEEFDTCFPVTGFKPPTKGGKKTKHKTRHKTQKRRHPRHYRRPNHKKISSPTSPPQAPHQT